MSWELTADLEAFEATAGDFVHSRPVEHTTFLTLVDTLRRRGLGAYGSAAPVFGWWRTDEGHIDGALVQTPPFPMFFSRLPAGAAVAALDAVGDRPLPGVNMLAADIDEFVGGRRRRTGATATVKMRLRLYQLETLIALPLPPGAARTAGPEDRALVRRWHGEFYEAIGEDRPDNLDEAVDDRLAYGGMVLWEVDGEPVAMAARSRTSAAMSRVQMVYTPASRRGRGYAGAATTIATRAALDAGASTVVLFTDLANPTSNGLYQRLGYRPIEDRVVVEFT